jgi:hypothetical protein
MDTSTITLISSTVFLFVTTLVSELLAIYNPKAGGIFIAILKAFQATPLVPVTTPVTVPSSTPSTSSVPTQPIIVGLTTSEDAVVPS